MSTDDPELGATVAATEPQAPPHAAPPKMIGRFVVDGPLGRGGMGLVVAAHDPELDRRVAIKLLHDDGGGSVGRTRLMREAQAMARLRHPNVVTVHEAGTHDGRFYVAMELVPGGTLRAWMEAHPRASAAEVLAMFEPAGRGLIAAHAAGLVHRDFKPENVLIDADGRVLVTDFGLAGLHGARPAAGDLERTDPGPAPSAMDATLMPPPVAAPDERAAPLGSSSSPLHQSLTRTGDVMGTPRYMSPEQHRGDPSTDARTDQFAFCATLYEALYGVRAFAGDTYDAIRRNAEAGALSPPPADREVPAWIHVAVLRGLQVEPDDRWPSMEALLEALAPPPVAPAPPVDDDRVRKWPWISVIVIAVVIVIGVLLWPTKQPDPMADQQAAVTAAQACDCELLTVELPDGAALVDHALLATGQLAVPRGPQRLRYEVGGTTYTYAVISLGAGASRTIALPTPERRDGFVFIPGGDVRIGDVDGGGAPDEVPVAVVHLAPYLITVRQEPEAMTFDAALLHAYGAHARLPTAAEWEWAARLGVAPDLLGKEWEWTATRYASYPYATDSRDDALAGAETLDVRGGEGFHCDPCSPPRPSTRYEGQRAGLAEVRLARSAGVVVAPTEVTVRIIERRTRTSPGAVRIDRVIHPEDLAPFHAFVESWTREEARPSVQITADPALSWCAVKRQLLAVGVPEDRLSLVEAPAGETEVIVRRHPDPTFSVEDGAPCRTLTTEDESVNLPEICFDGVVLRASSQPTIESFAQQIEDSKITEVAIDVHVMLGTPDGMAVAERRGDVVRKALFAAGVKAIVLVNAMGTEPIGAQGARGGRDSLSGDDSREPCEPGQAGLNDRVDLRILATD